MNLKLSNRSDIVVQSEIRNMSIECDRINGINLSQGTCTLEVPKEVRNGAKEAIDKGINQYTRYDGLKEIREAIAEKYLKEYLVKLDIENNIIVSSGATGALYCSLFSLLDVGDEVIIFEPYYGYHVSTLLACGIKIKYVKMNPPNWNFDINEVAQKVTKKTKAILICNPANPCGRVFTIEELEVLADLCIEKDLFLISDEIYEYFIYGGRRHISLTTIERIKDRMIVVGGYSKTFNITGWRIGYCISHKKWTRMIGYINDLFYVCAPAPLQIGVAEGIKMLKENYYQKICSEFLKKRDKLCRVLSDVTLKPFIPQGAYYILADSSLLPGVSSKEKAMYLLSKTGIASVPGDSFYHDKSGVNLLRFCFAKSDEDIDEACKRFLLIKKDIK
jgi:aminotransferase